MTEETTFSPGAYVSPAQGPYQTYSPPPRKRFVSDRRDLITGVLLLVLGVLAANLSIYGGFRFGYAVSWLAITLCSMLYLGKSTLRLRPYALLCLGAAAAGVGIFLWHDDGIIKLFAFGGMVLLTMLALCDATGRFSRGGGTGTLVDALAMWSRALRFPGEALPALFRVQKGETVEKRRFGGALIGLVCALPVLCVLVPLLTGADAAFAGLMELISPKRIGELISSLAVGFLLFMLLFTRLFSLRHPLDEPAASAAPRERKGADALAVNVFLAIIGGVYLLYLFSQLAYFVSAFSGILPKDYTVAQYARRGFFEMSAICAINLALVSIIRLISRKPHAPRSTTRLLLFILFFSLALIATALSKMVLYVDSFGMTRLRVLTAVFMMMLAIVILLLAIRLLKRTFPYVRVAMLVLAAIGLAVGYADVDTVIARYNVTAYQQGTLKTVDVQHLGSLSDGALPYLWTLREDKDPAVAGRAITILHRELQEITEEAKKPRAFDSLRRFSIDRYRARKLLLDNRKAIEKAYAVHAGKLSPSTDNPADYSRYRLEEHLGHYVQGNAVDYLGATEDYAVLRVYNADESDRTVITVGDYAIKAVYASPLHPTGLYVVTLDDGYVYSIQDAYSAGLIDMDFVYEQLLPVEMRGGHKLPGDAL